MPVKTRPTLDSATLRAQAKREVASFHNRVAEFVASVAAASGGRHPAVQYFFHQGLRDLSDLEQIVSACSEDELDEIRGVGNALLAMVSDVADLEDRAEGVYQLVGQYVDRLHSLGLVERPRGGWVTSGAIEGGHDPAQSGPRQLSYAA